jgi:transposase-like protein
MSQYTDLNNEPGRQRIVGNGYMPERQIQFGISSFPVKAPSVGDRHSDRCQRFRFNSTILPPYLRRTKNMKELIPWLYLKDVSTDNLSGALAALVGKRAPGLSAPTIRRLKTIWQQDFVQWQRRDFPGKRYVYFWIDGIYNNGRMDDKQCLLVIIGATDHDDKKLVALEGGFREIELSRTQLLLDLKDRGLSIALRLVAGAGELRFWNALSTIYPDTHWRRCWVHKLADVFNKLPKSLPAKAKGKLQQIFMAAEKDEAQRHFDDFIKIYGAKYSKAFQCLQKDHKHFLTFYDFPAEHWRHIRTTNSIESTFATVRLRTDKVRGCFSSIYLERF